MHLPIHEETSALQMQVWAEAFSYNNALDSNSMTLVKLTNASYENCSNKFTTMHSTGTAANQSAQQSSIVYFSDAQAEV